MNERRYARCLEALGYPPAIARRAAHMFAEISAAIDRVGQPKSGPDARRALELNQREKRRGAA